MGKSTKNVFPQNSIYKYDQLESLQIRQKSGTILDFDLLHFSLEESV